MQSWDVISKKVYWDRHVELEKWREKTALGHRSYLPDAVVRMRPVEFVGFYGVQAFKQDWPKLRAALPAPALSHAGLYDLTWSQLLGGG